MFETDRLPDGWSNRLNYMDEIWVCAYPLLVSSPSSLFILMMLHLLYHTLSIYRYLLNLPTTFLLLMVSRKRNLG